MISLNKKRIIYYRRFTRNRFLIVFVFMVFVLGICYLGSKTFWNHLNPWQVGSMLKGGIVSIIAVISTFGLLKFLSSNLKRKKINRIIQKLRRHGHISEVLVLLSAIVWGVSISIPESDHLSELWEHLQCSKTSMLLVEERIKKLESMPKYSNSIELEFASKVAHIRKNKGHWNKQDYHTFLNTFIEPECMEDPNCRGWYKCLKALALFEINKPNDAEILLNEILEDNEVSKFFLYYTYKDLGKIAWIYHSNRERAYIYWLKALLHRETRGLYQNMAIYHNDMGNFEIAVELYKLAYKQIDRLKRPSICGVSSANEEEAMFFINRSILYADYAFSDAGIDRYEELKELSLKDISRAKKVDPGYMDVYFNYAHLTLRFKQYDNCLTQISEGQHVLDNPEKFDIKRYNHFGYETYASKYLAWIKLRALYAKFGLSNLPVSEKEKLIELIPGLNSTPRESIKQILNLVENSGYSVEDDKN